jgi:cytoskeleton protein RodZ
MSAERTSGDFGSKLREARERRGVTLRQIANATKISVGQLDSLEKNDISKLPGGIFSRAFVRSYALEVGLDPETTIQDFIAQFPHDSVTIGHPTSGQIEDHDALESDRRVAGTFLWLLVVSVPVAAAVLYFSVTGRPVATTPAAGKTASAPANRTPAASPVSTSTPAGSEASPMLTPPGAAAAPLDATPDRPGSSVVSPAPSPAATAPGGEVLLVALSTRRPCWVSATVDGQKVMERLLQVGERRILEVRRELVITAGDASAIALTFNGADARPLGKSGEVVTSRFTLNNFKNFLEAR